MPNMDWIKDAIMSLDSNEDKNGFLSRTPKDFRLSASDVLSLEMKKELKVVGK